MVSPIHGRTVLDICAAVEKHRTIVPDLLAAHGLTGCDTVGTYFGIGKGVALRTLKSGCSLSHLGEADKSVEEVMPQCTSFMLACYNQSQCLTMTEARHKIWVSRVSRSTASAPKLKSIPPTSEAFRENVARAHLQVSLWKNALNPQPTDFSPSDYGWAKDQDSGELNPVTVPQGVALAPKELLKLIKCGCKGELPCSTQRCGCRSTGIVCTVFCACQGNDCWNSMVHSIDDDSD